MSSKNDNLNIFARNLTLMCYILGHKHRKGCSYNFYSKAHEEKCITLPLWGAVQLMKLNGIPRVVIPAWVTYENSTSKTNGLTTPASLEVPPHVNSSPVLVLDLTSSFTTPKW